MGTARKNGAERFDAYEIMGGSEWLNAKSTIIEITSWKEKGTMACITWES